MSRLAARTGKAIREISPAALNACHDYDYPGNVRELINILERAFVLCHEEQIDIVHLPPEVAAARGRSPAEQAEHRERASRRFSDGVAGEAAATSPPAGDAYGESPGPRESSWRLKPSEHKLLSSPGSGPDGVPRVARGSSTQESLRPEVQRLLDVLHAHGWNRDATAKALGISRSTLWRRMKEYGLL